VVSSETSIGEHATGAFERHLIQTERHVERLKQVFQLLGEKAEPKPCKAMMALVERGQELSRRAGKSNPYPQIFS
jgi:ferritin-like metal-binding protein YciE